MFLDLFPRDSVPPGECTNDTCSHDYGFVDYVPNLAANALYVAIFSTLLLVQLYQGYRYKAWSYTVAMVLGLAGEVTGYVGRIYMHNNIFLANPFLTYLICLTIAPVFFSAAIYLCLSRIVTIYGVEHSRLRPRTYTILFMTCDFISLVLQAAGGAIADLFIGKPLMATGVHIMVAGLAFQVFSLLAFVVLCAEFAWRVRSHKGPIVTEHSRVGETRSFHIFLCSLSLAILFILIRSSFRVAELEGGFSSTLANNQVLLMVLDGAMMVFASSLLTVFHAGSAFKGNWKNTAFRLRSSNRANAAGEGIEAHGYDAEMDTLK